MTRMAKRLATSLVTVLVLVVGSGGTGVAASAAMADEPLFVGGFKDTAMSPDLRHVAGIDGNSGDDWGNIGGWVEEQRFQYLAGQPLTNFVNSEIVSVTGRLGTTTAALRMTTIKDDPNFTSQTRNELSLYSKPPPNDFREGFVRYWVKLPTTLAARDNSQAAPWWNFMEWKEPNSGTAEGEDVCGTGRAGGTNNYRVNVNLRRDAGQTQFYWLFIAEQVQPCRIQEWSVSVRSVPVPIDQWFKVEAYFKKAATGGRLYFAVNDAVVLDTATTPPAGFTGRTQHRMNPRPLEFWSPFKVYHDPRWWQNGQTKIVVLYDEFSLYPTLPATEAIQ